MKNKSFIIVVITNIVIASLSQVFYWSILLGITDVVMFQVVFFPLIIGLTNLFLGVSKYKLPFYQHSLAAYFSFFISVIIFFFMSIDPYKELPPGEIILFADLLFIALTSTLQLMMLLAFNLFIYLGYRVFLLQKRLSKNK